MDLTVELDELIFALLTTSRDNKLYKNSYENAQEAIKQARDFMDVKEQRCNAAHNWLNVVCPKHGSCDCIIFVGTQPKNLCRIHGPETEHTLEREPRFQRFSMAEQHKNGKGSKRRPTLVPDKVVKDNWDRVFKKERIDVETVKTDSRTNRRK